MIFFGWLNCLFYSDMRADYPLIPTHTYIQALLSSDMLEAIPPMPLLCIWSSYTMNKYIIFKVSAIHTSKWSDMYQVYVSTYKTQLLYFFFHVVVIFTDIYLFFRAGYYLLDWTPSFNFFSSGVVHNEHRTL